MNHVEPTAPQESIAVIGMKGRFPGARNVEQFWENLRNGVESITRLSDDELLARGLAPSLLALPELVKAGSYLDDIDLFDAMFFGFSARDAEIMDPQHRLFLETAWEALEGAGYYGESYPGLIGVFGGTEISHYLFNLLAQAERLAFVDHFQMMVGNDKDHLTTHVSYKLSLRGPSVVCQTACSTSLVAVTIACQSLLTYQCDMALAGGVAISLPQRMGYFYQQGAIVSPDGHCRPFDAAAQGTVGGNGVALVVLKRLSDAIADRDNIHAVIRGAAINNDGSMKAGYTAPSIEGQAQCIALAQAMAGVTPDTVTYIEAHGTATPLGDPIEVAALTEVFRAQTEQKQFCAIGSVKSNLGHLNAAAGVTGLIKAVLAVEHGELPPSLHYRQPNPEIDFPNSPFHVQAKLVPWTARPRRAGVNSFGIGGTNAHVVLEEAPPRQPGSASRPWQLLLLSARTTSALEKTTDNLAAHLRQNVDLALPDVAFTLQVGRKPFAQRRVLVTGDLADAAEALAARDGARVLSATAESSERPVAFLFPGQGTQYPQMARDIYEAEPAMRESVDTCAGLFQPALGYDLRSLLFPETGGADAAARQLRLTAATQAALFTVEYGLAQLWIRWGIVPAAMIGHSIGEYVAACLAGVMSLEDAVDAVALRGQLMQSMPAGAMLGVPLSEREAQRFLSSEIELAAVNAPGWSVLTGPAPAIELVSTQLNAMGIAARVLHTSHAFHSAMMDPIVRPFVQHMKSVALQLPSVPYLSNVTGTWITPDEAMDPAYYGRQLRKTVRYSDGIRELLQNPGWLLLEVGPGRTLTTLASQRPGGGTEALFVSSIPGPQEPPAAMPTMVEALGRLWMHGASVNWAGFYEHEQRCRVSLPTYPFERQRYWIGEPDAASADAAVRDVTQWFYAPAWKQPSVSNRSPRASLAEGAASRWLILADRIGIGAQLAAQVRAAGHEAICVNAGGQFSQLEPGLFTARPEQRGDYEALLAELRQEGHALTHIVHLWNVTPLEETVEVSASFDREQVLGFHSLVKLAQALEKQKFIEPLEIGVVTNHARRVLGDEPQRPGKATLHGAAKVLAQEYPHCRCRTIDVSLDEGASSTPERLAAQLAAELTTEPFEAVVAYRKGRRWVETFERLPLIKPEGLPSRLRQDGVYLITGGLGQIGFILAEVLARSAKARLALVGRSALPAREDWPEYLERNGTDAAAAKIRRLRELEALGSEVLVLQADVSNREEMQRAISRTVERFGTIHGVIHGAGNTSADGAVPLNQTGETSAATHFLPKARGLFHLEELLRGRELDFVLLLSSLSSVLGGLGFTAYAAGNAFLDAFAAYRQGVDRFPWISVNWDAWQFAGEPVAAAASFSDFILPADGQDAFLRIVNASPLQVAVSTSDLQARLDQWVRLSSLHPEAASSGDKSSQHPRPNLSSPYAPPRDPIEQQIAGVWENLLGVAPVGIHDKFFELGGHSLLAIQLVSRLREMFKIEMPVQRLFEAPTVAELAASVKKQIAASPAPDAATEEEILRLVEAMSEEEVKALLAEEESRGP